MKSIINRIFRFSDVVTSPVVSPLLSAINSSELLAPESLLRLGTDYGGWIIPIDSGLDMNSICYLAGAGEDISFDCALVKQFGCLARVIDPTPRAIDHFRQLSEAISNGHKFPVNNSVTDFYDLTPQQLTRMKYLPVGLADKDVELKFFLPKNPAHVSCSSINIQKTESFFIAQCHRLASVMTMFGDNRIDLLKMDIEGAEYAVICDLVAAGPMPRLLLIEFDEAHSPLDKDATTRINKHVQILLDAGMRCIAVEGSNMTLIRRTKD